MRDLLNWTLRWWSSVEIINRAPVICPASDVLNLGAAGADVYTGLPVAADVLSRESAEGDIA